MTVILLWMSFFSISWIPGLQEQEGRYTALIILTTIVSGVYYWSGLSTIRLGTPLSASILLLAATSIFSVAPIRSLKELGLWIWIISAYFIARHESRYNHLSTDTIIRPVKYLLLASVTSIVFHASTGGALSEVAGDFELIDRTGLFLLSTDLLACLVILSLFATVLDKPSMQVIALFIIATTLLFLNNSKTHLIAVSVGTLSALALATKRKRTRLIIASIASLTAYYVLFVPNQISKDMLYGQTGISLFDHTSDFDGSPLNLNTSGRLAIWSAIETELNPGPLRIMFGHGLGSAKQALNTTIISDKELSPHSEWVRLYFDIGIVGVGLFAMTLALLIRHTLKYRSQFTIENNHSLPFALCAIIIYIAVAGIGYEMLSRHRYSILLLSVLYGYGHGRNSTTRMTSIA